MFLCFQSFAQKTFEIYNFSSYPIKIYDIITQNATGGYPEFTSKPNGLFTIAPGGSFILENTSNIYRFPFESPASTPYLTTWGRKTGPSTVTYLTSPQAWVLGNSQVFYQLQFDDGNNYYADIVPTGPLFISNWVIDDDGLWTADYECVNPPATNVWFYSIVFYDL